MWFRSPCSCSISALISLARGRGHWRRTHLASLPPPSSLLSSLVHHYPHEINPIEPLRPPPHLPSIRLDPQNPNLRRSLSNMSEASLTLVERAKRDAAYAAIDQHVQPDMQMVGIGSGSTIVYGVERIAAKTQEGVLGPHIKYVPTSFQAKELIMKHGLPLGSLDEGRRLDVTIDGCDEADEELTLIKGGGGCLAQEKVVAYFSKEFVVIADYRKRTSRLGTAWAYIPIEVLPLAYVPIKSIIEEHFGGSVELRMAKAKAGPVVTDNSNFILDWHFRESKVFDGPETSDQVKWSLVNQKILAIPGVVETGLFINMAQKAYFGQADGSVQEHAVKPV